MMPQMNGPLETAKSEFLVIPPRSKSRTDFYIPEGFFDAVVLHIVKNTLAHLEAPLMLAIQGPKGEGKSMMSREVCSQIGVYVVALPGASLSGVYEKEPILILRDAYLHASALRKVKNRLVALLIDDLDTSVVATHSDRRYTVNTQLLSGMLMYLCDDPYHIGEQETGRIPIVVTGNDFTTLHEPLTRHGRAQFYDWRPDPGIKTEIVRHMFTGYIDNEQLVLIDELVKHFSCDDTEPIAFYHTLRSSLYDEVILRDIHTRRMIDVSALDNLVAQHKQFLKIGDLIALGERQRNSRPRCYT